MAKGVISTKIDPYMERKIKKVCEKIGITPYQFLERAVYWYYLFSEKYTDKEIMMEVEVEQLNDQVKVLSDEIMELQGRIRDLLVDRDTFLPPPKALRTHTAKEDESQRRIDP